MPIVENLQIHIRRISHYLPSSLMYCTFSKITYFCTCIYFEFAYDTYFTKLARFYLHYIYIYIPLSSFHFVLYTFYNHYLFFKETDFMSSRDSRGCIISDHFYSCKPNTPSVYILIKLDTEFPGTSKYFYIM